MTAEDDGAPDGLRDERAPFDVSLIGSNLPFVLRTFVGMAILVIGANVVGVLVVALATFAVNATASAHQRTVVLASAAVIVAIQVVVGTTAGALVQRRTLRWLLRGERPSHDDAVRALRMQLDMAVIVVILWLVGDAAVAAVSASVGLDGQSVLGICGGVAVAGMAAAGITYLLVGRVTDPIARLALASRPPQTAPVFSLQWRLFVIWLLTSGAPVVGIVLVVTTPRGQENVRGSTLLVAIVALILGLSATLLTARAIGGPLREMVEALHRVGQGELDVSVSIQDSGEIGLVQNGFNDMVAGLRERERIQDLFGRHVGPAVAAQAIRSGVTLSGESREAVALFVDIAGSTRLTHEMEPVDFVAMLNRFFEIVVDEVEGNGGLLNKFEGDAALCVFGAPAEIDEPAAAALRAARAIRDRVAELNEVEIGIGVAAGPVIAGQIGSASRLEYTVIGDAVNEAARLTELAKRVDGRILTSEPVVEQAGPTEQQHWVRWRVLKLRGREHPTRSYRSVGDDGAPSLVQRIGGVARAVTDLSGGE
ncbi:MAG TPA: adenylate/guanylate cyclase domain-containing protein [Jatrophihabitans sp.]|nr:adenylate/guanylate cyclase domain-containing protein [Jatrophihabitans sp.]